MPTVIVAKRGVIAGTKAEIAIAPRPFAASQRPDPRSSASLEGKRLKVVSNSPSGSGCSQLLD